VCVFNAIEPASHFCPVRLQAWSQQVVNWILRLSLSLSLSSAANRQQFGCESILDFQVGGEEHKSPSAAIKRTKIAQTNGKKTFQPEHASFASKQTRCRH
jgi:hypothetical protein